MINGDIKTLKDYKGINAGLDQAIDFLLSNDLDSLEVGKTKVNDLVDITKLVYVGKDPSAATPEEHRNHLDLQILLKGHEICTFDYLTDDMENHVKTPYNPDKDVVKYDVPLRHRLIMDCGNFTLFTPNDVHCPSQRIDDGEIVKLVTKILIK